MNYNPIAEKKSGEARKQAGKKKKGCGENEFLPACLPAAGGASEQTNCPQNSQCLDWSGC